MLHRIAVFLFGVLLVCNAQAQSNYPNKSIRWVVPWPAGGIADTQARLIAEHLGKMLGQQVVVDNRPGGSGIIGAEIVAKSKPDGYTLLYVSPNEQAIAQALGLKVPYDASKAFTPITQFLRRPPVLVASDSLKVRTVADLVKLAKSERDSLSYGTPGVAHFNHFVSEVFNRRVGIDVPSVPYKGEAPMLTDMIGGQVAYGFAFAATVEPLIKAGRLRALATTGRIRSPQLPEVPTFTELGMPDLEFYIWTGMAAPAQLPAAIVNTLQTAISKVLQSPALKARREFADSEIVASKPEVFAAHLTAERARWIQLVKQTGITPE
ncbi:MAG: tripartite tricarboxylate transporter substrate binding protein [Betaproteobacteria bacterium]|nr:tripartite tricarboxylate transporter substrate binding protein [Betaproteobacteria bacterium]